METPKGLNPLSQSAFDAYCLHAGEEYRAMAAVVEKRTSSSFPPPGAKAIEHWLPQGIQTPDQRLYEIQPAGSPPVGVLWVDLHYQPRLAELRDVFVYPAYRRKGYATQAIRALEQVLREAEIQGIQVAFYGEQQSAMGLFEKLGYRLTNLHMLRDLSQPRPDQAHSTPPVRLEDIDEGSFQSYLSHAISDYAKEKVEAGNWKAEEALERSRQEFLQSLPNGRETAGQYLYNIVAQSTPEGASFGEKNTGIVWWGPLWDGKVAYLWDFLVYEPFRGQGYAKGALFALEDIVRSAGIPFILLHVFAHNQAARALYEKVGYWNATYYVMKTLINRTTP